MAYEKFFMNKAHGRHMQATESGEDGGGKKKHPHSVHIHHAGQGEPSPDNPHHVHVHHADGSHEHSDHGSFQEAMDHVQSKHGANDHDADDQEAAGLGTY